MSSPITTHILDTARGTPASGVSIRLCRLEADGGYTLLADGVTDDDGRIKDLLEPGGLTVGTYRMLFKTGDYFEKQGIAPFYPEALITFVVYTPEQHYHIPLLLSPSGYSTYRGS